MQKTKIKATQEYALGEGRRYDGSRVARIRILDLDATFQNEGGYPHYGKGTHQGIQALVVDDAGVFGISTGDVVEVSPRDIWETWADWATLQGQHKAALAVQVAREREREARQKAEIEHMLSLVPAEAWAATNDGLGRPLTFLPGATPRITVADLTLLLKAARTAALEEAGDE